MNKIHCRSVGTGWITKATERGGGKLFFKYIVKLKSRVSGFEMKEIGQKQGKIATNSGGRVRRKKWPDNVFTFLFKYTKGLVSPITFWDPKSLPLCLVL